MFWDAIIEAVFYKYWWLGPSILGVLALVALAAAYRIFGWEKIKGFVVPVLTAIAAVGALSKARSQGYQDRKDVEEKARKEAEDFVDDKKDEVDDLPDDKLDDRFKRWEGH